MHVYVEDHQQHTTPQRNSVLKTGTSESGIRIVSTQESNKIDSTPENRASDFHHGFCGDDARRAGFDYEVLGLVSDLEPLFRTSTFRNLLSAR